ncbi:clathrin light chain A isoform X2 [Patella vulgata]|uniref:clathrin light chain A isoform X2 n=1 Tax=Patella vulgata TaxID=6465 RepID=UPI00218097D5|nr:clathrin light chain A isoform X2 [Patella vulgata]
MADLESNNLSGNMEDDPAADFLAREQSELAGLEDDNPTDSSVPQDDGFGAFGDEVPVASQDDFGGSLDEFEGGSTDGQFEQSNGPSDSYSAISQQDTVRVEPEKIRLWREEQKDRLEKKDINEIKKKEEWQSIAKKELEDWYKHHAEQLSKTKENNIAAEKAFIKERDESVPGHEWEKICRLCEFNPKHSKSTKDVTRMRSILLQLKQTPLVR